MERFELEHCSASWSTSGPFPEPRNETHRQSKDRRVKEKRYPRPRQRKVFAKRLPVVPQDEHADDLHHHRKGPTHFQDPIPEQVTKKSTTLLIQLAGLRHFFLNSFTNRRNGS